MLLQKTCALNYLLLKILIPSTVLSSCSLVFRKSSAKKLFDDGGISKIVEKIVESNAEDSDIPNALVSINTGHYA